MITTGLVNVEEGSQEKSLVDRILDDRRSIYILMVTLAFVLLFVDTKGLRMDVLDLLTPEPVLAANLVGEKPEQKLEIPFPAMIGMEDRMGTSYSYIEFGEGDTFTQTEVVPVTKDLVLPTILFKEHMMGRGYVVNRPAWISLVDLDHLRAGSLENYVTWEVGIWKNLAFETAESSKGLNYVQINWNDRNGDHVLDIPNGNAIRLSDCSQEVFVRFDEQGMPIFMESVPDHQVLYSVGFEICSTSIRTTTMDAGERVLPIGELNSEETELWRHFHMPVDFE